MSIYGGNTWEHGKNNFGETKVAITLRGMVGRRYSEVVFPVFLETKLPNTTAEQVFLFDEEANTCRHVTNSADGQRILVATLEVFIGSDQIAKLSGPDEPTTRIHSERGDGVSRPLG